MGRPSFFLVCSVKVPDWRRRIIIPLPLWVLDDLLRAGLSLWRLGTAVRPELDGIVDRHLPEASRILPEVSRLIGVLRKAGPFTLVDVNKPEDGVSVSVRLV